MKKTILYHIINFLTTACQLALLVLIFPNVISGLKNGDVFAEFKIFILVYTFIASITIYLSEYIKFFKTVNIAILIPVIMFIFIFPFLFTFLRMFFSALLLNVLVGIFLWKGLPLVKIHLNDATIIYCSFTFTFIIYSFVGNTINHYWLMIMPKSIKNKVEPYNDTFDQNKFSYLIFVLAFILLLIFSLLELNQVNLSEGMTEVRKAMLASFATYVAWDRLISKKSMFNFNGVLKRLEEDFYTHYLGRPKSYYDELRVERDKEKKKAVPFQTE